MLVHCWAPSSKFSSPTPDAISTFADQLVAVLEWQGFTPIIDRKGIHGAEKWEERLGCAIPAISSTCSQPSRAKSIPILPEQSAGTDGCVSLGVNFLCVSQGCGRPSP
jgi:hypothetical protein